MLQNPVNPETPYMRGDMVYGLLANVAKNSKFFDECKIFDIGKVRQKVPSAEYLVPSTSQLGTKN
jgi:phenylalanyl-tRNA synthetase beta subunit